MSDIQVLDNTIIYNVLINLSKEETIHFQDVIEQALKAFSIGDERQYQPKPSIINRANGLHALFRPFVSESSIGTKIIVQPAPEDDGRKSPLRGVILLCDKQGIPNGLLSAEEITGYRTAMCAMIPFSWRKHVEKIVIFGAGMQALWHTRLILALRGSKVKSIMVVNRSRDRVDGLISTVSQENATRWRSGCVLGFVDATNRSDLQDCLRYADCIFCTTPSREPLFPAEDLSLARDGKRRRPFISAVGSRDPDMIELNPALLHRAITGNDCGYNPITGDERGVILTDDREFAIQHCGEFFQTKITENIVDLGEIIDLNIGPHTVSSRKQHIGRVNEFLSEGFVIYKSIGVSLTDLAAAEAILALFKKQQQHLKEPK
jgi:ornithine cyclodeaminase/alanine dehydrogenase-like protein (mu-crystallin family)